MSKRTPLITALLASSCLLAATPAFADVSYDFSTQDGNNTSTPVTIGGATFSSPGGPSGAFYFSPNTGLYSAPFDSEVLSEAGSGGSTLTITFATPQSDVGFLFSLGDFFGTNDPLTITTNTGAVLTAVANAPSNGDFYPEGTFSLLASGQGPVTSIALTSSTALPITIDDLTSVAAVPLPASFWLFGSGLLALGWFGARRRNGRAATGSMAY